MCPRCVARDFFTPNGFDPGPELAGGPGVLSEDERWLADYELLDELSRGGMGVVYRARQVSLGREVAVKFLLHGALAGDGAIARFRAEAESAASLRHPNIVPVYEVGDDRGRLFFSMELVTGSTLAELVRDGPLAARRAAGYLRKIAEAVHYAHQQGVLHRDLKPSNVLVDERDEPRVMDFGLAKRVGQPNDLTLAGQVLGTPAYISPEQADGGRTRPIDARSDLYSLGAVLYHLLAGRPPFTGESPTAILRQVAELEPIAPRLLNPTVPRDLETICLKCLEKEPGRRYATAAAMADDLARFLREEPIRARPITPPERAWRWCRREPALAAALAGVVLLLGGIALTSTVSARRIERLRLTAFTNLYASDMRLAQQAIAENKFGVALDLLERHRPDRGEPDLRGFEWRHFYDECQGDELATLGAHGHQAQRAAFSPDGRWIATADTDVRVWDFATRQRRWIFPCTDFVRALTFSPDGRQLAAAEAQGGLRCFDLETGRETNRRLKNGPSPFALQWPTQTQAVNLWAQGRAATWDLISGDLTNRRALPVTSSRDAVSDHGVLVSLQHPPWRLEVWQSNAMIAAIPLVAPTLSTAVSRDGQRVAAGDFDGMIHLFELAPNPHTNWFSAHRGLVNVLAFSPDKRRLASGGADATIRLWDAATGQRLNELRGHRQALWALAFSPDGETLVSGDAGGEVKLWPTRTNRHEITLAQGNNAILAVDGSTWVVPAAGGGQLIRSGPGSISSQDLPPEWLAKTRIVAVSTNGLLARATDGSLSMLVPGASPRAVAAPRDPTGWWLSPDARWLVGIDAQSQAPVIWNLAEARETWRGQGGPVRSRVLAISSDSQRAACGDLAGRLRVIDVTAGGQVQLIPAHANDCYAADFSPDASRLVSAGHDGFVRLWDAGTGRMLAEFRSSVASYWSVALSPDGQRVAAGTAESTIVLWDMPSRQEVATFRVSRSLAPVEGLLRFAPDGCALLSNSGGLQRWIAPPLPAAPGR